MQIDWDFEDDDDLLITNWFLQFWIPLADFIDTCPKKNQTKIQLVVQRVNFGREMAQKYSNLF